MTGSTEASDLRPSAKSVLPWLDIPAPYRTASSAEIASAGLIWLGVLVGGGWCSVNLGRLLQLPMRSLPGPADSPLAFVVLIAALGTLWVTWKRVDARHWTTWWDPARLPDGPISWLHVRHLVRDDPLSHVPRLRLAYFLGRMPLYILNLTAFTVLAWFLICLVDRPWLPDLLRPDTGAGKVFQQLIKPNLTAYLALIAAAASIFFAYVQLRAKVRADNRQAWIDRARSHLAVVTSRALDYVGASPARAPDLWKEFAPLRVELELMLNSSEKDHRLLAFLLHELALLRAGKEMAIEDSENLKAVIEQDFPEGFDAWLPRWREQVQLVTYVLRLSHVVLKREWERVKHTR